MADQLRKARVLVVHEWLLEWAGAERQLAEIMRVVPQADLIVGAASARIRAEHELPRQLRETWLARIPFARTHHRWFIPLQYPAFRGIDTRGYDLVISSSSGFGKAVRAPEGSPHACYCYSPPRYLWDLASAYDRHESTLQAMALRIGRRPLQALDRHCAAGVTTFSAISRVVAGRVERAYGKTARVIYPAVESKPAGPRTRGKFLLTLGRLVAYKRVDVIIQAARQVGLSLVVAGDGPERARLERLAQGSAVTFTGRVDEAEGGRLMEECAAFVFCAEEDFGIAPLEANAHGAPVVGLARGALTETMTTETAEFFDTPEPDEVAAAIARASSRKWNDQTLRANPVRFAPEIFRAQFTEFLNAALP